MATWVDGGPYGRFFRGIDNNDRIICFVWTEFLDDKGIMKPWHSGEANFRLILQASVLLEALEAIRDKADDMMEIRDGTVDWTDWQPVRSAANAAIAAVEGESDEDEREGERENDLGS